MDEKQEEEEKRHWKNKRMRIVVSECAQNIHTMQVVTGVAVNNSIRPCETEKC